MLTNNDSAVTIGFESDLWRAADALRSNWVSWVREQNGVGVWVGWLKYVEARYMDISRGGIDYCPRSLQKRLLLRRSHT